MLVEWATPRCCLAAGQTSSNQITARAALKAVSKGTKNCIRTAREKTLPFQPITGRIRQHFMLYSLPSRIVERQVEHRVSLYRLRETQYAFESKRNHELSRPGTGFSANPFLWFSCHHLQSLTCQPAAPESFLLIKIFLIWVNHENFTGCCRRIWAARSWATRASR